MAMAGYRISNDNSNSQQKSTAGYKQINESLLGSSPPARVKTTTNTIDVRQYKYANIMSTIPYGSNDLNCGYITGIHFCSVDKRNVIQDLSQSIRICD